MLSVYIMLTVALQFTTGAEERLGQLQVKAGRSYKLEVHFSNFKPINSTSPYAERRGGIRLGGQRKFTSSEMIGSAVALSLASDGEFASCNDTSSF